MASLKIHKLTGSGNDFVVVDNRTGIVPEWAAPDLSRAICARGLSVGADGLILLERSARADFRMRIFNPDGSEAEMCGNGSRCACLVAFELGAARASMTVETLAGVIEGTVNGNAVRVKMPDVKGFEKVDLDMEDGNQRFYFLDTGVPHAVTFVSDLEKQDVAGRGRTVRYHARFRPRGTNVDFVGKARGDRITIRTYERGVEGETLACGTGCVAAAISHCLAAGASGPIVVRVRSGEELTISFDRVGDGFENVFMEGAVKKVFEGTYFG
jgi:diaminopimelate epimerase